MIISPEGVRSHQYWSPTVENELVLSSDEEYVEAFKERFDEAVECRLRTSFPIGSHLSGGLDSSSITCVARNKLSPSLSPLHTFSNIFDNVSECDERSFIQPVLDQGGVHPHWISADQNGAFSSWHKFLQQNEEPCLFGANGFLVWHLNQATQHAGVRVCLNGFDGDTTVSHGAGYFAELARQGQWQTFQAEADALSQHFDTSPATLLRTYGFTYLTHLAQQGQWPLFAQTVNQINMHFNVRPWQLWLHLGIKPLLPLFF